MPHRYGTRRAISGPFGPTNLLAAALLDGATTIYTFKEGSGDLINRKAPGTNDLSVDAAVTRSVAGTEPSDKLAYQFPATGLTPLFGHAEGTRENIGGTQAITFEAVLKIVNRPVVNTTVLHFDRNAGSTLMDVNFASANNNLRASIAVQGESINNQILTTAGGTQDTVYAHYVWQWDGTTFRTWRNGVNQAAAAIGGGGEGIQSGSAPYNVAFGGFYQFGVNAESAIDFFAMYSTVHLTAAQIAAHYRVSGC